MVVNKPWDLADENGRAYVDPALRDWLEREFRSLERSASLLGALEDGTDARAEAQSMKAESLVRAHGARQS